MKNKLHPAEQYAHDVVARKIVVCKYVQLSCKRYFNDLNTCTDKGLHFDRVAAEKALNFIQKLKHYKGQWAGQYFLLEPWQQFIVWNIFGWKRADGSRRYRYAYIEVARKNGKTILASGIALYMMYADGEAGAEVYSAATTAAQARICFNDAAQIVKNTALNKRLKVQAHAIIGLEKLATFKPLSSAHETQDGFNPSCAIIDEFHAHKDSGVYDVIRSGLGARRQPLMFIITTAGTNRAGVCYAYRDNVIKVLQGVNSDDSLFGIIYTLDKLEELENSKLWVKSNPNIGISLAYDFLAGEVQDAKNRPSAYSNVMTKNFNIWVDADKTWIGDDRWVACKSTTPLDGLANKECWGGLDLSNVSDITAFVLLFNQNDKIQLLAYFWIPEEKMEEKIRKENINYAHWVREGFVKVTPGNVVDYDFVKAEIMQIAERYNVKTIAFDRWNASQTVIDLQKEGLAFSQFGQGYGSMSAPSKQFETLLLSGKVEHYDNPVLRWMLASTAISSDPAGNIKPDKQKSSQKIDGIVASIMAIGQWLTDTAKEDSCVYEKRGLRSF